MKKRINLFSQRIAPKKIVNYYKVLKKIFSFLIIFLIISNLALSGVLFILDNHKKNINKNILSFQSYISQFDNLASDISSFIYRYNLFEGFTQEDLNSNAYLSYLTDFLNKSRITVELKNFSLNTNKETSFSLEFLNYEDAILFTQYLEKESGKANFEFLKLDSFSLDFSGSDTYSLNFSTKFKTITNDSI